MSKLTLLVVLPGLLVAVLLALKTSYYRRYYFGVIVAVIFCLGSALSLHNGDTSTIAAMTPGMFLLATALSIANLFKPKDRAFNIVSWTMAMLGLVLIYFTYRFTRGHLGYS